MDTKLYCSLVIKARESSLFCVTSPRLLLLTDWLFCFFFSVKSKEGLLQYTHRTHDSCGISLPSKAELIGYDFIASVPKSFVSDFFNSCIFNLYLFIFFVLVFGSVGFLAQNCFFWSSPRKVLCDSGQGCVMATSVRL